MSLAGNQAGSPARDQTNPAMRTVALILKRARFRPALAVILGSGFHSLLAKVKIAEQISYARLPGFPRPRIQGHPGELVLGHLDAVPVLLLCGRAHFYEGLSMAEVTFPVRVLAELGIRALLLTNAAGAINSRFWPGDFMCLTDHINFMGTNPLRGEPQTGRTGFVDLSHVYDLELNRLLKKAARSARVRLHGGVYLAVSGPTYETPAEIRAFARLGADAVGMSTVPEAIVARQCGLRVVGVSCLTNLAAGQSPDSLSHDEVLAVGGRVQDQAAALLRHFARMCEQAL